MVRAVAGAIEVGLDLVRREHVDRRGARHRFPFTCSRTVPLDSDLSMIFMRLMPPIRPFHRNFPFSGRDGYQPGSRAGTSTLTTSAPCTIANANSLRGSMPLNAPLVLSRSALEAEHGRVRAQLHVADAPLLARTHAEAVAPPETLGVVGAVALLTELGEVVSANGRLSADDGRRQLVHTGAGVSPHQHRPWSRCR